MQDATILPQNSIAGYANRMLYLLTNNNQHNIFYISYDYSKINYAYCTTNCAQSMTNWTIVSSIAANANTSMSQILGLQPDGANGFHLAYVNNDKTYYTNCSNNCLIAGNWQKVELKLNNTSIYADTPGNNLTVTPDGKLHAGFIYDSGTITTNNNGGSSNKYIYLYGVCTSSCTTLANWNFLSMDDPTSGTGHTLNANQWSEANVGFTSDSNGKIYRNYAVTNFQNENKNRLATCSSNCTNLANWSFGALPETLEPLPGDNGWVYYYNTFFYNNKAYFLQYADYNGWSDAGLNLFGGCNIANDCTQTSNWGASWLPDALFQDTLNGRTLPSITVPLHVRVN